MCKLVHGVVIFLLFRCEKLFDDLFLRSAGEACCSKGAAKLSEAAACPIVLSLFMRRLCVAWRDDLFDDGCHSGGAKQRFC